MTAQNDDSVIIE